MAFIGRRRTAKTEDPFYPYINHQGLATRNNGNSSTNALRREIERYKTEIQTLRRDFHEINTSQLSMIESLQQENQQLSALNEKQSNTIQRLHSKLSAYQTACRHKDDEITRLTLKLDAGLQHVTSEYVINEQKKEICALNAKLERYQRVIREQMEMQRNCDRHGAARDAEEEDKCHGTIDYYLDSVTFMLNWVQSKYNG